MATKNHNLSEYDSTTVPSGKGMRLGIVVSEWNNNITDALLSGAVNTLKSNGVSAKDITVMHVPGSFELIYGCRQILKLDIDAVIAIGCVIRGDTPHFDYICEGTTHGLSELNLLQDKPVIYGLITTNNMSQAEERCGGILGNKGDECAITALKMVAYHKAIRSQTLKSLSN
jgi:6,7-dimethyl-8-ribityllumazine synthase